MDQQHLAYAQVLGSALLFGFLVFFLVRGARARTTLLKNFSEVFPWSQAQRKIGIPLSASAALVVFLLPHLFPAATIPSIRDLFYALMIVAGFLWGLAEGINRCSALDRTSVAGISWSGRLKSARWDDVTRISYHDFYGGFFLVHSPAAIIFLPVQVDRPLDLIAALEAYAPSPALAGARKGIALCKAVFSG